MIDTIINAALRAGRAIMNIYTHPDLDWQVERKADNSPLTLADRESHRVIAEALESTPLSPAERRGRTSALRRTQRLALAVDCRPTRRYKRVFKEER